MPIARSTVAGATTGVLLLAAAVGFGVGLPEVVGDDSAASSADIPALPDRLGDRLIALSTLTAEDAGATAEADVQVIGDIAAAAAESDADASSNLASMYGAASVRAYIDVAAMSPDAQSAPAQLAATITPGDSGLVIPSGPFEIDQTGGAHYELREVDGHRCAVAWQEPVDPTTGEPTGAEVPVGSYQTECRTERDGLTYDVYATGLAPEDAAGYLDLVLEVTAESD